LPTRILYVSQSATITTPDGNEFYFPVQSANCETTNPVEDVLSFGLLGAVTRVQQNVSTCRSTIKTFLNQGLGYNSSNGVGTGYPFNCTVNAAFLSVLTGNALNGQLSVIQVVPDGFTMSGILGRVSIDGAIGALAMCDLEFMGVGQPNYSGTPASILGSQQLLTPNFQISGFSPVTTQYVSGSAYAGTGLGLSANSLKFTLDIPNDTITCLGNVISGSQAAVSGGYAMVAKAPFKANLTIEGTAVDPSTINQTQTFYWGTLGVSLTNPIVTQHGFNQATNSVGASYSFTIDDVSCIFH
jgi:hypothetical protein